MRVRLRRCMLALLAGPVFAAPVAADDWAFGVGFGQGAASFKGYANTVTVTHIGVLAERLSADRRSRDGLKLGGELYVRQYDPTYVGGKHTDELGGMLSAGSFLSERFEARARFGLGSVSGGAAGKDERKTVAYLGAEGRFHIDRSLYLGVRHDAGQGDDGYAASTTFIAFGLRF